MRNWAWWLIGILSGGFLIAAIVIAWRKQSNFIKQKQQSAAYARDAKSAKSFRINDEGDGNEKANTSQTVS